MSTIDISNLNKADVLAALFNGSRPQGLGFLRYQEGGMTTETAQAILDSGQTRFDYLQGRVMKINLSGDSFESAFYDRDNGDDAAQKVIDELRSSENASSDAIQCVHTQGRTNAASQAHEMLGGGEGADAFVGRYLRG